ncbi:laccase-13 [Selaginella moellendorffii]|nr:laccase-13 [Selaginella moellendorffii]|eukprot:XP_002971503.2 laccase-13 [Selaginella moellendorffii]
MHSTMLLLAIGIVLALAQGVQAGVTRHYNFTIQSHKVSKLCSTKHIISVNRKFPGPTIHLDEGDRVVVKVTNRVPHNMTIHWHGVRQLRSAWFDGPAYITQCPIQPNQTFTYNFTVTEQRGTLWWHAHINWLRATVHGAFIIHPKPGLGYPFPKPEKEVPLVFSEWWKSDVFKVVKQALGTGGGPNISDAFTINGKPGPLYNCSSQDVFVLNALPGKTYLLRLVNAVLNTELFFAIANHTLTVVEADAGYVKPFNTNVVVIAPGQTMNLLVTANQAPGRYFMAAHSYESGQNVTFDNTTVTAIFQYQQASSSSPPVLPPLPFFNDTKPVTAFNNKLRKLATPEDPIAVPQTVDQHLFFTVGLAVENCPPGASNKTCQGPNGGRFAASVNNITFTVPTTAILQAHYFNTPGVYSTDFPFSPLVKFNYTGPSLKNLNSINGTRTKVAVLPYGANVELILQDTSIVTTESHPIHLHGYNFYVVGTGFGNYNSSLASTFNLVDPPERNTIGVPVGGWAALRFKTDNPGAWFMHCHLEIHQSWGLDTAFIVNNGKGPSQSLQPPPADLPKC